METRIPSLQGMLKHGNQEFKIRKRTSEAKTQLYFGDLHRPNFCVHDQLQCGDRYTIPINKNPPTLKRGRALFFIAKLLINLTKQSLTFDTIFT